jgi:GR25 family glycosyltransferase involved in LPS biosynthesis
MKIKIYILRQDSRSGDAFRVPTIIVNRISADQHQLEVSRKIGQPVLASMASIPSRRDMLRDCVSSLLAQCDKVRVFLNGYPDVPGFLEHPRVEVRRSQDWDDRGDAGKFFWIDRDGDAGGYRVIVDDDLVFPPDFTATMTAKVAAHGNKAVYATHGVLLRQPIGAYYETSSRATTFHFGHQLGHDRGVHIGATNAMCFHAEAVRMRWADFKYCNSADVWLSLYAQDTGLPVLTPARPRHWIRENRHTNPAETIYHHSLKRTRSRFDSSLIQDAVLRHARRLTLQVNGRLKCGFCLYVTGKDDLVAAMRSWLSWRSHDVEWVVVLAYDRDNTDIAAAVRSLEVPHEVHLLEVDPALADGVAAFLDEIGVEAALCAGDTVRFARPTGQDSGSSASPDQDADGLEALLASRKVSQGRLAILPLQGARSRQTQAFVMGRTENRRSWMADMLGNAALGQAGSPLDADFAAGIMRPPPSTPAPVPAKAGSAAGLNDLFERVLVLNLDRRPDRWEAVSRQFERFGIRTERMAAVDGRSPDIAAEYAAYRALPPATVSGDVRPVRYDTQFYLDYDSQQARLAYLERKSGRKAVASAGAWGYLRSYERLLEQALAEQTESLIVFDDDAVLHNDFRAIFADAVKQLPSDWLIVQLGTLQYNWSEPWAKWLSPRLYSTNGSAVGSHAVGMRFDIYPFLLDHVRRMDMPFDIGALSAATRAFPDRCFVIYPNLAIQRLQDSDIGTSGFQQGRSIEQIASTHRWNLADYGL